MSGRLACHQPNLMPWFPFFYKMNKADKFVLMINCQFEKNGYQNRANVFGEWWTLPTLSGLLDIKDKKYANGYKLTDVNIPLIMGFAKMLGIDFNKVHYDFATNKRGTERIIELCKTFDCDQYLTNIDATNKYLDERLMNDNGIEVVPCVIPNEFKKHLFEMFQINGIEGTIKILNKDYTQCQV